MGLLENRLCLQRKDDVGGGTNDGVQVTYLMGLETQRREVKASESQPVSNFDQYYMHVDLCHGSLG